MTIGVVQQVGSELDRLNFGGSLHYSHTATLPSSPTPGNLLVVFALLDATGPSDGNPAKVHVPTGWTARVDKGAEVAGAPTNTGTAILIATKVACPGEPSSLTIQGEWVGHYAVGAMPFGHSIVQMFELNGGWGGATAVLPQNSAATHTVPSITPTAGAEAFIMSFIANENAYGRSGGPSGGYTADQLTTTANDGSSVNSHVDVQHVGSASGSYNPGTMTYAVGGAWTNFSNAVQIWIQAGFDSAPCLGTVCDFSGTPLIGSAPLSVDFTDLSTGTPTSWLWDFGDGSTSTVQNPTHVYTVPGLYTVELVATDAVHSNSKTRTAYVRAYAPAEFDVYRIDPPGDGETFLATIEPSMWGIRPELDNTGSGGFTINRHSVDPDVLAEGNLVRVRIPSIDDDYIFAFFIEKETVTVVSADEEGGEDVTISGRGILSYWERAIWLSAKFVIPWWDGAWGTPPVGARGHVTFAAGTYLRFTIAGGVITGSANFTTSGFEAYFDTRQTYLWPSKNSKRFLVHIMTGETHAGWYVHPHQDGVVETLPTYARGTSIELRDIGDGDKPGQVLERIYAEGTDAARPAHPIALATIDFDDTDDSNGDPWSTTDALEGVTAGLGETYLSTIFKMIATGVVDVDADPYFGLHAYNSVGRDLTGDDFGAGVVRFEKGVNIADQVRRELDDAPVATFTETIGTDNVVGQAQLPDAASRVAREVSTTGDSNVEATLEAIGLANLNARLVDSDAIAFGTDPSARPEIADDDDAGRYLPGPPGSANGKYWLGDLVRVHTGTGDDDFNERDLRVHAVTIGPDDAGNIEAIPEVGSVLGAAERALFATAAAPANFAGRSQFTETEVAETSHPDLTVHDDMGLATDTELSTAVAAAVAFVEADLTAHTGDAVDAHDASAISFAPASGIAATDVQAAIVEDAGDLAAHLADATDAHDASAISIGDAGGYFASSDVEGALQEIGTGGIGGGGGGSSSGVGDKIYLYRTFR